MRIDRSTLSLCVLFAFAAIALFFFVTEHTAHQFGLLPHLLVVLCLGLLYLGGLHDETQGKGMS
jgi:hypothetical protein